jgi:hypothetical protein
VRMISMVSIKKHLLKANDISSGFRLRYGMSPVV